VVSLQSEWQPARILKAKYDPRNNTKWHERVGVFREASCDFVDRFRLLFSMATRHPQYNFSGVENMKTASMIRILVLVLAYGVSAFAQKSDFNGSWTMDRARSFGLPGNMNQSMVVSQTGDEITVETKLIQPDNERTVKDTYVLDGKERDFTPQVPAGAPPAPPAKAKRTASWLPSGNGIVVTEVTTSETPKGPVTSQVVRKWTISNGELVIAIYVDNPNASYEAKRIFVRK
jgi:hypothetical protein